MEDVVAMAQRQSGPIVWLNIIRLQGGWPVSKRFTFRDWSTSGMTRKE
jgi:hypothetical protein